MLVITVIVVHIIVSLFLVGIVLLQHGKGADAGATFGGSSQTLFGASGADTILTKVTTGAAVIFMLTSLFLASHARDIANTGDMLFKGPIAPVEQTNKNTPLQQNTSDQQNQTGVPVSPAESGN